jgi:hypothetical protein
MTVIGLVAVVVLRQAMAARPPVAAARPGTHASTPRGACRVGVPTPIGTPYGCHAGGTGSRGTVQ